MESIPPVNSIYTSPPEAESIRKWLDEIRTTKDDQRGMAYRYAPNTLLVITNPDAPADWDWDLEFAKPGDVGMDLPILVCGIRFVKGKGEVREGQWLDIPSGSTVEIPTGLSVKVPNDSWGNVKSRSSTGFKHGLIVLEGVIDSGYTGPLYSLIHNPTNATIRVTQGMKLAQLVLIPKYHLKKIMRVDKLPTTDRANTGFGSSGL